MSPIDRHTATQAIADRRPADILTCYSSLYQEYSFVNWNIWQKRVQSKYIYLILRHLETRLHRQTESCVLFFSNGVCFTQNPTTILCVKRLKCGASFSIDVLFIVANQETLLGRTTSDRIWDQGALNWPRLVKSCSVFKNRSCKAWRPYHRLRLSNKFQKGEESNCQTCDVMKVYSWSLGMDVGKSQLCEKVENKLLGKRNATSWYKYSYKIRLAFTTTPVQARPSWSRSFIILLDANYEAECYKLPFRCESNPRPSRKETLPVLSSFERREPMNLPISDSWLRKLL